jgi:hypothetical protein
MGWCFAGFEVRRFSGIGLPSVSSFRVPFREFAKDCLIRPRHLYYQTNRDKLSEWSCGI